MKPHSESHATVGNPDILRLARGVRFAIVAIVFGICILNFRLAFSIRSFEGFYASMLESAKLPVSAQFALDHRFILTAAAVLLSLGALSMLFHKKLITSFYLLGVIGFITLCELLFFHQALWSPFMELLGKISGDPFEK